MYADLIIEIRERNQGKMRWNLVRRWNEYGQYLEEYPETDSDEMNRFLEGENEQLRTYNQRMLEKNEELHQQKIEACCKSTGRTHRKYEKQTGRKLRFDQFWRNQHKLYGKATIKVSRAKLDDRIFKLANALGQVYITRLNPFYIGMAWHIPRR